MDAEKVRQILLADYLESGARLRPICLAQEDLPLSGDRLSAKEGRKLKTSSLKARQDRHG